MRRSGGAVPITTATSSTRNTSGATCSQSPCAAQAASSISTLNMGRSNQSSHFGKCAGTADHQRGHRLSRACEESGEVAVGERAVDLERVGPARVAEVLDARAVLVAPEAG